MKMNLAIASVAACLMATSASAATFEGIATGSWTDPLGENGASPFGFSISNGDAGGTADVNWGTGSPNNRWRFDGVGSDGVADPRWEANAGEQFKFGDFFYRNGSVNQHNFVGASLSVALSILVPNLGITVFDFDFGVINTTNTNDPVESADTASIIGNTSPQAFSWMGQNYTLSLVGFSTDNGMTTTSNFNVLEGADTRASLYGRIDVAAVPLPATLSLGLMALGALGAASRRRKNKA